MGLKVSQGVRAKLANKHQVAIEEVEQCFANRIGVYLEDTREQHKSDPPTKWFIAETDFGRKLKIVFVLSDNDIVLKTAYVANSEELRIYNKFARPLRKV